MLVDIEKLQVDNRNSNVCTEEILAKLKNNIQELSQYAPLIVRPDPTNEGFYIIVDGHHRLLVLKELGYRQVHCEVWDVTDEKARLALATLNRLRGQDDYRKRSELIESLIVDFDLDQLCSFLPENTDEVKDMLALLRLDEEDAEKALKEQRKEETNILPVPFTFMVMPQDRDTVCRALDQFSGERTDQFIALCEKSFKGEQNE